MGRAFLSPVPREGPSVAISPLVVRKSQIWADRFSCLLCIRCREARPLSLKSTFSGLSESKLVDGLSSIVPGDMERWGM